MLNNNSKLANFNVKENEQHPFHLVDFSPWPIMTSMSLMSLALGFIFFFHFFKNGAVFFVLTFIMVCFYLFRWFSDIITEATFEGHHTSKVQQGIRLGMCLFIASEVMFFFSFFWAYFHSTLSPASMVGCVWPVMGINSLDPMELPLLNTVILLSSGVTITWAHKAIILGDWKQTLFGIIATVAYGVLFTGIQIYEYRDTPFGINDGVFGSLFFMLTGFHGFHVLVGSIFLLVCLYRHYQYHFTRQQHVGLECAIWYWHFVDVVWLFLYVVVYNWGR